VVVQLLKGNWCAIIKEPLVFPAALFLLYKNIKQIFQEEKMIRIDLPQSEIPKKWYNIQADMDEQLPPPIHPGTKEPVKMEDLQLIFPDALIMQEMSRERYIDIPEEILEIYNIWRPSPLMRAKRLEEFLGTPAKIYYKYEGVSPAGSHKPNTAVAQAFYNKKEGIKRLATETGAGQWGSALALAGAYFNLEVMVYMVKVSFNQKPYRKFMIETWGGKIAPSPSNLTEVGRKILSEDPDNQGSLGIAISEAVEDAASNSDTNYALGSVLNHVCLHQTIIGEEAIKQFEKTDDYPDVVIGCVGGGSNFAGIAFPYIREKLNGKDIDIIAVEPSACPTMTKGEYTYDYGDLAGLTPILKMYTLGHTFMPPSIHAGGLRYHGMAPLVSYFAKKGLINARSYNQPDVFKAAIDFARVEGLIVAPESSHAVKAAIDEAIKAKKENKPVTILFNLSGHGFFDLSSYDKYNNEGLVDYALPEDELERSLKDLPEV
jgi:tryptophan synthase beta chain